ALGIGLYTTGRAGLTIDNTGIPITYCLGAGFVLDTAVATDELFNYRLNVGWEDSIADGTHFFKKGNANRVYASNTFGLGVFMNRYIRLWTGPQLDIGCQFRKISENTDDTFPPFGVLYKIKSTNYAMFFLGFGAVLGLNVNPVELFTISIEVGVNTAFGFGKHHENEQKILVGNANPGFTIFPMLPNRDYAEKAFGRIEGFSRLSFMFRVGDTYTQTAL
ncbi:MAG: hypothetical protein QUS13_00640, partial [Smithella sp.]|nr:hypothetical protein [Smithella sp.]